MALVHPSPNPNPPNTGGYFREMDVLERLRQSLPDGYEIFHHLDWQALHEGQDRHGELDLIVMSPWGSNRNTSEEKPPDFLLQGLLVSCLALPDHKCCPAGLIQGCQVFLVSLHIADSLCLPEGRIRLGSDLSISAIVHVPETAMNEDDLATALENQVR